LGSGIETIAEIYVKHPSLSKGWACEPTALASGKLTRATARLAWSSSALRGV
jgi:hypothetical protein